MAHQSNSPHAAASDTRLGLAATVERLRSGALTSEQLTRDLLERIARYDSVVRAWAWLDRERALEAARQCDQSIASGDRRPLIGIPLGIKDVIETAGIPTEMGSPVFAGFVPHRSAAVVRQMEESGAFVLGKTVTTEFATQYPGPTTNPWNPLHTPGGSSSGSAAAVAAGFVPAALGTQTRGSIVRPAAYCGVVGYKPTYGLLSTEGVFPLSHTLDHVGLFADRVRDVAVLAAVLLLKELPLLQDSAAPPRLAAVKSPLWHFADPVQQGNFHLGVQTLTAAGAQVEMRELPPVFSRIMQVVRAIQLREIADLYADKMPQWGERVSKAFREYVAGGAAVSRDAYQEALALRQQMIEQLAQMCEGVDAIITPPATGEAPLGLQFTGDASLCAIWTLCGMPALSIRSGTGPTGLPMGLQVVGARHADGAMISAANWCEIQLMAS
jgi:Asp-tRNA(Asn)/Glu-tRNA(Gln) amidotransferase A subunit family amidase